MVAASLAVSCCYHMQNDIVLFMKESNYFSWESLPQVADIDSHILFASTLLDKYDWKQRTRLNLEKQLAAIVEKQNDKMLNISVIGEFSTGKSSFINALVGYELLAVNVIQGTTVAITIIEFSEDYSLKFIDFDGKSTTRKYQSINALRQELHIYTTDSAYANRVNYVIVTLPSEVLKNGYRIIDTPGTNSLELWHESITRRAIKEISDLSIILTDATQPMTQTLKSFVEEAIGDAIKNCIFVANKIDCIRECERNGIIQYVEKKISRDLGVNEPIVLPFSSVALTNAFSKEKVEFDDSSYKVTTVSLQQLLSYTAKQKIKAQAHKLLHLIDGIYTTLDGDMRQMSVDYQNELELLERSKQTDLKPFIDKQILLRKRCFLSEAKDFKYKVESVCDSLMPKAQSCINNKIDDCINLDKMSEYIKGQLSNDIKIEGLRISKDVEEKYGELKILFKNELKRFQKDFENEFQKLKILSIRFNLKPKDIAVRNTAHSANISSAMTLVSEELSKENWSIGGGMVAGATIGTAILPGIGTFVGGFLGGFFGAAAAPDTSEVKNEVKSKLATPMQSYFRTVISDILTNYNNYVSDISSYLESEINRYYYTYASVVQQKIAEWKKRHHIIKTKISKIENEIDGLKNRQIVIKSLLLKL